jgi:hypothetical protein
MYAIEMALLTCPKKRVFSLDLCFDKNRGVIMPSIFISYRREDSAGWAGRLPERLKQKFGSESIFMDVDAIQPGTDFTEALRSAVGRVMSCSL